MNYYFSKVLNNTSFEETLLKVKDVLKEEGFGIITEIDLKETFKQKLNVDFNKYKILGACNPQFAYKALQLEDKIGTMLPCNIVIKEQTPGKVEVTAVDPVASMQAIKNSSLSDIAAEIAGKLRKVVESL